MEKSLDESKAVEAADGAIVAPTEEAVEKVESERHKGHMLDVAPGHLAVELPCGYIRDDKVHTVAVVREMTGYEEDLLAARGPVVPRLNKIISNCMVKIGEIEERAGIRDAVAQLTANDRMAIMIGVRRVSLGDFYDPTVSCPSCKAESKHSLDLSEMEVFSMPDRMLRERESEIMGSNGKAKTIKWHVMRSEDEEWLTKRQKKNKEDVLTLNLLSRVDAVDDVQVEREKNFRKAVEILKSLSIRERGELRETFKGEEGYVDIEAEFECPECGHEWKADMDVGQPAFFFPSAT